MFEGALAGLALLTPTVLLWMVFGVVFTTVVAVIPGLGGVFAMAIMLPFAFTLPPEAALAMLMAAVAVEGTGNTVTGVLFGVPGSATGVATVLDGYPMAQNGEATRAISAGLTASAVGGVIGALILVGLLPFMRPLVLSLGPPEFFALIFAALLLMSSISEGSDGSRLRSTISGFSGLLLAFVGLEISTGLPRYTFEQVYLWDGIRLVPMTIGLFAVAEMLNLLRKGSSIAGDASIQQSAGATQQTIQGMGDVFRSWRITVQSSVVGMLVGVAPGVGGAAAQFLAYTQAKKTSRRGQYFGTGEVEGVIAADAATNSKDGASLIPTLAFGIPGTATAALLLVGMIGAGVQPGPSMLTDDLPITWMFIWVLVLANILAAGMLLLGAGQFSRLTKLKPQLLVPPIWAIGIFGAFASTRHVGDIVTVVAFGVLGYAMILLRFSRANFIIGFVLGVFFERFYLLSMRLHGAAFLLRPVVLGILGVTAVVVLTPVLRRLVGGFRYQGSVGSGL